MADLGQNLGPEHPITRAVQNTVDYFRVHYVLNLFNGVEDSFKTAVKPFVDNLTRNVSSRVSISNLGWITRSDAVHRANCDRIPALLLESAKPKIKKDRVAQELEDLRITAIGLDRIQKKPHSQPLNAADPGDHLSRQLNALKTMYAQKKDDDYVANFEYISERAMFTIDTRRPSEFGDTRIWPPEQMLQTVFVKARK